ncbi:nucleotidyltransferase family protein [Castellaniella sp.]|uniref:nucleotidyltransferase family protein n=1 Tax=Castellaniella sp. TaxID=1955812 RepID=UPI002AFFDF6B|nr:nucleotidyltransferase family protein [Castellaniella sp.]
MEAIVLAGGYGTRLRAVVSDVPKPMAPVAGRPFLEIVLDRLAQSGFTRVVLAVGYLSNVIIQHFGESYAGMDIDYVTEDQPLGTGGAMRQALDVCQQDPVFVFNGDTYLGLEIQRVMSLWQAHQQPILVARHIAEVSRYGSVALDAQGFFAGFSEKGLKGPGLINAGCYVLPRHILNAFPVGKAFSLETDYLAQLPADVTMQVFVTQGLFIDIGVPDDYMAAQGLFAGDFADKP